MFSDIDLYWNCPCLSVYKILVSVKALAGVLKSHLVTALDSNRPISSVGRA